MPVTVEIKRQPAFFDGAPDKCNISVVGAPSVFTRSARQQMHLWGLASGSKDEAYMERWATRFEVGGPMVFLASYLSRTFGYQLGFHAREVLSAVVGPEDVDGFEGFLGSSVREDPGAKRLSVAFAGGRFLANCNASNTVRREALMKAGWYPLDLSGLHPSKRGILGTMPFCTTVPLYAQMMAPWMVKSAQNALPLEMAKFVRNLKRSDQVSFKGEEFNIPIPEGETYGDHQTGIISDFNETGEGGLIADEMGTGKTIEFIGISNLRSRDEVVPTLITCKANAKYNWEKEYARFDAHGLSVGVADGSFFPDTDVVIINYDIVPRHKDKLHARTWALWGGDEIQTLKSEKVAATKVLLGDITGKTDLKGIRLKKAMPTSRKGICIPLSGTPIPNHVSEFWSVACASMSHVFGEGYWARVGFLSLFCPADVFPRKQSIGPGGERIVEGLVFKPGKERRPLLLNWVLKGMGMKRRLKENIPGMPAKTRQTLLVKPNISSKVLSEILETEREMDAILEKISGCSIKHGGRKNATRVIDAITKRGVNCPEMQKISAMRKKIGLIKAPYLAEEFARLACLDAEKRNGRYVPETIEKTVTFAHHKDVVKIFADHYRGVAGSNNVLVLDGSVGSARKKEEIKTKFQTDKKYPFIVISLSGATSITLTKAHRLLLGEFTWSPSEMVQLEDRIARFGQSKTCHLSYGALHGSLDDYMAEALFAKMSAQTLALDNHRFVLPDEVASPKNDDHPDPQYEMAL